MVNHVSRIKSVKNQRAAAKRATSRQLPTTISQRSYGPTGKLKRDPARVQTVQLTSESNATITVVARLPHKSLTAWLTSSGSRGHDVRADRR